MKKIFCTLALAGSFVLSAHNGDLKPNSKEPFKIPMPSGLASTPRLPNSFNSEYKSRLGFEKNKGQYPEQAEFKADLGRGRRVFMEKNKFTYVVYNPDDLFRLHEEEHHKSAKALANEKIKVHAFEMVFVNANSLAELEGGGENSFYHNYFIGNDRSKWATNVPVYKSLTYKNLYEGIDLVAYENEGKFKYDYVLKAGVDAKTIQLQFNGVDRLQVKNKNLSITTSVGEIVESVPYSYQVIDGREVAVACEYMLAKDGKTVSFYLPNGYDTRYDLIIDPVVVASTYSGSNSSVFGHCATYDVAGNIYTGGRSFAVGYPTTVGAAQVTYGGNTDICISKLNPTGSTLTYATYLGGNAQDSPHSMFVDANNELYVYGSTSSPNYPVTTGCYDNSMNGITDIIITKLNISGSTMVGSTYVGGSLDDGVNNNGGMNYGDQFRGEIVVTLTGEVFIAGTTTSTDFPVTTGVYDATHNGLQDAIVFKMNSNLNSLTWATYLGGSADEIGCSIRVNGLGEIYVVGSTGGGGFPTTPGALNTTYLGSTYDGFVAHFNSTGTTLLNSTFIGTSDDDITYFVDIDTFNGVYIYGVSNGPMPMTAGVYGNAGSQSYIQKLSPALNSIVYATTIGNGTHGGFAPSALMVDICQNVYIAGCGGNTGYPVTPNASQATTPGSCFYVAAISQNATSLLYGSFFGVGGEHVDGGTSRFDPSGKVYQAVCCCSPNFPTLPTAHAPTNGSGGCDIVVFKIDFEIACNPLITNTVICHGSSAIINVMNVNNLSNPTYSIVPGGGLTTNPNFTVQPTVTTTYSIYITGTNGFNVVVTNTGISTVSVMPNPQLTPSFTQATCTNSTNAFNLGLSFMPAGPAPSYTVFWSPVPAGITSVTQTALSGGIPAGVYSATVTTAHGCQASTVFTMNPVPTTVNFSITGNYIVTCAQPEVTVTASNPTYSYTWYGNTANYTGTSASFTIGNTGNWVVIATDLSSGCVGSQSFVIGSDVTVSSSTVAPLFQNITCSLTSVITVTAVANPSVNISHYWISPLGGTLTMGGTPAIFVPGGPGTYTHVAINMMNGCQTQKTFTVTSTSGFPTYSVVSPQNFTIGCTTTSVATINIIGAQTTPTGGAVSYTILSPTSSTNYIPGSSSTYTTNIPGTFTVITKDNANSCETKVQISVLQHTFGPDIGAIVPQYILNCFTPSVVLQGLSNTPLTGFSWQFPATPGTVQGNTIVVNTNSAQPSNTLIANYTLTVENLVSTCKSSSIVTMQQNLFKPNVVISGGNNISCNTTSITLTNQSSTTIPPNLPPVSNPISAISWKGPSPQEEAQIATTYVAYMPGTYTLVVRDMNNGCTAAGTKTIDDFRDYPQVLEQQRIPFLDCGQSSVAISPDLVEPTAGFTYTWLVSGIPTSGINNKEISVSRAGQYNVIIRNTLNGCYSMAMLEVVNGTLQALFSADQVSGYAPLNITLTNNSSSSDSLSGKKNITSYWNFGNGTTQSSLTALNNALVPVTYTLPGTYTVTLFAQKGVCLDTMSLVINVDIPSELSIPNIFTPNGDGTNDLFFIKATNLNKIDMIVVDRWGHKVYELSTDKGNVLWDGKNQYGKEVADGTYFYTLKASGTDGTTYDKKGTITIAR